VLQLRLDAPDVAAAGAASAVPVSLPHAGDGGGVDKPQMGKWGQNPPTPCFPPTAALPRPTKGRLPPKTRRRGAAPTKLSTRSNLHTIVRLPNGVFAPYTNITTNLLFFDRTGPTKEIWYYEQPLPEGRKQYTKTAPLQFEEFADCLKWWSKRKENERAWKVP